MDFGQLLVFAVDEPKTGGRSTIEMFKIFCCCLIRIIVSLINQNLSIPDDTYYILILRKIFYHRK